MVNSDSGRSLGRLLVLLIAWVGVVFLGVVVFTPDLINLGKSEDGRDSFMIRRKLIVRVLQEDGKTPAGKQDFYCFNRSLWKHVITDEEGRLVFEPMPPSIPTSLQVIPGTTTLGPFEMPDDKLEAEVTLTMPARKSLPW